MESKEMSSFVLGDRPTMAIDPSVDKTKGKIQLYTPEFRQEVVEYTKAHSIIETAKHFKIHRQRIHEWKREELGLPIRKSRKKVDISTATNLDHTTLSPSDKDTNVMDLSPVIAGECPTSTNNNMEKEEVVHATNLHQTIDEVPSPGEKRRKYCEDYKKKVVQFTKYHKTSATAKQFGIDRRRVNEWKKEYAGCNSKDPEWTLSDSNNVFERTQFTSSSTENSIYEPKVIVMTDFGDCNSAIDFNIVDTNPSLSTIQDTRAGCNDKTSAPESEDNNDVHNVDDFNLNSSDQDYARSFDNNDSSILGTNDTGTSDGNNARLYERSSDFTDEEVGSMELGKRADGTTDDHYNLYSRFGPKSDFSNRRPQFSVKFKREVVDYSKQHSVSATARHFGLHRQRVFEWRKIEHVLYQQRLDVFRVHPKYRPQYGDVEKGMISFLLQCMSEGKLVTYSIIRKKAIEIYDSLPKERASFVASKNWLKALLKRNSFRLKMQRDVKPKDIDATSHGTTVEKLYEVLQDDVPVSSVPPNNVLSNVESVSKGCGKDVYYITYEVN